MNHCALKRHSSCASAILFTCPVDAWFKVWLSYFPDVLCHVVRLTRGLFCSRCFAQVRASHLSQLGGCHVVYFTVCILSGGSLADSFSSAVDIWLIVDILCSSALAILFSPAVYLWFSVWLTSCPAVLLPSSVRFAYASLCGWHMLHTCAYCLSELCG